MKYDTIIFDLDGTLLNTLMDMTDSVNFVMDEFGFARRTVAEVRRFIGNGILRLMELCVPGGKESDKLQPAYELFKRHYAEHCLDKTEPYPGVINMVKTLKARGYKMAVVSNKFDIGTKALVKKHFSGYIDTAIGETPGIRKKPAPDSVFEAMGILGSSKEKTVYIGDSDVDIATAKNAGLNLINVTWGFRDRALLESLSPQMMADSADEVLALL